MTNRSARELLFCVCGFFFFFASCIAYTVELEVRGQGWGGESGISGLQNTCRGGAADSSPATYDTVNPLMTRPRTYPDTVFWVAPAWRVARAPDADVQIPKHTRPRRPAMPHWRPRRVTCSLIITSHRPTAFQQLVIIAHDVA